MSNICNPKRYSFLRLWKSNNEQSKRGGYMKKGVTHCIVFGLGAFLYCLLEILWRGRTHWSMFVAGGLCFLSIGGIARRFKRACLLYKCILGSIIITTVEFVFGCIFNLWMRLNVWDYSRIPFNIGGQVCLLYSVLWGCLCSIVIPLAERLYSSLLKVDKQFNRTRVKSGAI